MSELSKVSKPWQAKPVMAGYHVNGYLIARGDEEPIARTICKDEADDEQASELIVAALNRIESAATPAHDQPEGESRD